MRLRNKLQKTASIEELLRHEAEEHDEDYAGKYGFNSQSLEFSKDYVWRVNDHAYKKDTYKRGAIKRRLFQVLDLDHLATTRVLDVGCGNGQHAVFMAMYGARVSGFDLSPVGLRVAQDMAEANGVADLCDFRIANISELPYKDEEFDIVLHNAVLHHILKYPNVREETFRVLKPGGRVVFVEGLRDNPLYRGARTLKNFIRRTESDLGDVDLELQDILEFSRGFTDLHLEWRCLFEGVKEGIAKPYGNGPIVRGILLMAKLTDDVVLKAFPKLERYCSEIIGYMSKPTATEKSSDEGIN